MLHDLDGIAIIFSSYLLCDFDQSKTSIKMSVIHSKSKFDLSLMLLYKPDAEMDEITHFKLYKLITGKMIWILCISVVFQSIMSVESQVFTKIRLDLEMDRIEMMKELYHEGLLNVSQFRVTKFRRTTAVINLNSDVYINVNEDWEMDVFFYFNRSNNNQYTKHPARIFRDIVCNIIDQRFKPFLTGNVFDNKDAHLPKFTSDEKSRPIPKV